MRRYRRKQRSAGFRRYRRIGANPIPLRMRTKLHYVDTCIGNVAAGASAFFYYQSSLFDPYAPAGGHQPLYFDQYAAMYGYYRVYGIGYEVEVTTPSAAAYMNLVVYSNTDASSYGTLSSAAERKGSKMIPFSAQYRGKLRGYISIANLWAVSKKDVNIDDEFAAAVTTGPVKAGFLFFHVYNSSSTAGDIIMPVKLTYYCEFFRPITVSQS